MSSVLLPYANAYLRIADRTSVAIVNGRVTPTEGDICIFKCFLKRAQYSGTSSGSKLQPLPSQLGGEMMPGTQGDAFYYRGYYLQCAIEPGGFDWLNDDYSTLTFVDVTSASPTLRPGTPVNFLFGDQPVMRANVERSTGVFGGLGIDEILYKELGGVELQLTGAEFTNV